MTNEEKKAILLKAIEIVKGYEDNRYSHGLCRAVDLAQGENRIISLQFLLNEYGIEMPPMDYGNFRDYCFPLTKEGDAQRIALLEEAIKRMN